MTRVLAAVDRYQAAPEPEPVQPPEEVARKGSARLLSYGGTGRPVLFVPSLVNPPYILDLGERSLLRWLAGEGFAVHLIDWGRPEAAERGYALAEMVTERLEPLAAKLEDPVLAGYCLGGTLAIAAAQRIKAAALLTIAAPWNMAAYPPEQRQEVSDYWQRVRPVAEAAGLVSMDLLQPAFWALDPALPVRKFERYAAMRGAEARRFERMEDWANSGEPISLPAVDDLIEGGYRDDMFMRGWQVGGERINPARLDIPWLDIRSATDRIVPNEAAPPAPEHMTVEAGHVGMIVGSRARELLWKPMAAWLQSL